MSHYYMDFFITVILSLFEFAFYAVISLLCVIKCTLAAACEVALVALLWLLL